MVGKVIHHLIPLLLFFSMNIGFTKLRDGFNLTTFATLVCSIITFELYSSRWFMTRE